MGKKYIYRHTKQFSNLLEFKIIVNRILEEKIYHYSIEGTCEENLDVLVRLQNLTKRHMHLIHNYTKDLPKSDFGFFTNEKIKYFLFLSFGLKYKTFLDVIKYQHGQKEEMINTILREMIEEGHETRDESIRRTLMNLRDEWRGCLPPEVLDEENKPIISDNILDKAIYEIIKTTVLI